MLNNLQQLDHKLSKKFAELSRFKLLSQVMKVFALSGELWVWLIIFAWVWYQYNNYQYLIAVLIVAVVNKSIKYIFKRKRPAEELSAYYQKYDPHSFPSSHSARAGMIFLAAFHLPADWIWVGVAYALLVILSRLILSMHYISDVVVGFCVGVLVTWLVFLI